MASILSIRRETMDKRFEVQTQQKKSAEREREIVLHFEEQESPEYDEGIVKKVNVLECGIVNLDGKNLEPLPVGTGLHLEREPSNQYDRWAILVKTENGKVLGYIPAGKNQSVARLMDAGKHISACVADSSEAEYQKSLKVFDFRESTQIPLRLFWEIPVNKGDDHG